MKKSLIFACAFAAAVRAPAVTVASGISAVTVYLDRAVVTRSGEADLAAGNQEIVFEKLPATLLDRSLQVSGRGAAGITILDVSARPTFVDFTPNARVKTLEDALHDLQRQFRALDDRAATLNEEREFVKRMLAASTAARPDSPGAAARPSLEEWQRLYAYSEETLGHIAGELQALDNQREDLTAKKSACEQQLGELRGAGGRSYKTVTVRVAVASPGSLQIVLAYTVPSAGWSPSYDARVLGADRAVQLDYFGLVHQNTGEDWKDVALTLSTARPSLGGSPPPLPRWSVDVAAAPRPAPRPGQSVTLNPFEVEAAKGIGYYAENTLAGSAGGGGRFSGGLNTNIGDLASSISVVTKQQLTDAGFAQARFAGQITSASFKIPVAATVLSDNSPQKVPVTSTRLEAVPEYVAIPKQLAAAFLTAKVTNSSDFPLLAGVMNVFLDDTFVATSDLRTVMPGEKFDLALGADDGIAVQRRLNNRFTEDTGLVNHGKRITYDFTLTVQNNKRVPEDVVVQDQMPVSRNEKVVVTRLAPDDKAAPPDSDGTLKWTLALKPGEKRELPLKFCVEYPNEVKVSGLE